MHSMRNRWRVGLILILTLTLSGDRLAVSAGLSPQIYPGEVLVKIHPGEMFQATRTLHAWGLSIRGTIPALDVLQVSVPVGQELSTARRLAGEPWILYAEPNYRVHAADTIPNDPAYSSYQWNLARIGLPRAWDVTTGGPVVIAIVDTGVDLDHPDLAAKLITGTTFITGTTTPDDDHWHGTHVAGIAAAATNNGLGVAGVSWGARIMPIKILDSRGDGTYADLARAIIYAADHGARIINMSLGGEEYSQVVEEAIDYARERGCLLVAAAGNNGGTVLFPAASDGVLAVAATDSGDRHWVGSNQGSQVDVAAPGVGIYSTGRGGVYFSATGTSMATPHVSGLAALIWSVAPELTPVQVSERITSTAKDLGAPGWDPAYGWGRIEAYPAVVGLAGCTVYLPLIMKGPGPLWPQSYHELKPGLGMQIPRLIAQMRWKRIPR